MLRSNNNRTRSQLLGLSKRNGTMKPPNSSNSRKPMTPSASVSSSSSSVKSPPPSTRMGQPATEGFTEKEILELKESFRLFDVEEAGRIGVGSFRSVLESLLESNAQSYPHLEEILRLLSVRSDDETLDFEGYLSLMAGTSLQQRLHGDDGSGDQPNFQHVFDLFDVDGKGYVTVEDLRRVALELGENDMTMDELQEMIDRARSKKSGKVTLKEFSKIMTVNLFQKTPGEAAASDTIYKAPAQDEN